MSNIKRQLEDREALYSITQSILEKIRAIKQCEYHEGTYLTEELCGKDIYALATNRYKEINIDNQDFDSFHKMIKIVLNDCNRECYSCKKNMRD